MVAPFFLAAVSAVLNPSPAVSGNCNPTRVHFSGHIASDGPGKVTYTWIRLNHPAGRTFTLDFEKGGALPVSYDLLLRKAEEGSVMLRVLLPAQSDSVKANFRVTCK